MARNSRNKCMHCTRLEKHGEDLYYCDYCGTYFSEVATYRTTKCDRFHDKDAIYVAEPNADYEILETECFHCGKKIAHGIVGHHDVIEDIYCDECKPIQRELDRHKCSLALQSREQMKVMMYLIVQQAIRDYKSCLVQIKKTPFSIARHKERKELEEYFFSNDFKNQMDFLMDYNGHEDDGGRFELHVVKLLNKLRKECDYDARKYNL